MNEVLTLSKEVLRQLQLTELEMIVEVDRICRKYGIHYSLDGGTLLGAVRHKGFVPWDDDADVIFTRHEYAKFYHACKKELDKERFFLQEYRTDPEYRWGYAKLRRLGTEFVRAGQEQMKYKTGVCIDVFVVDHVPDHHFLRSMYYGANFCIRKILYSELGKTAAPNPLLRGWYGILSRIPRNVAFGFRNRIAALTNRKDTELVSHLLYPYPRKECRYGMPSVCFTSYMELEFEGMKFQVFKEYDRYLTILYGDYMTPPPPDKRKGPGEPSKISLLDITLEDLQERYYKENGNRSDRRKVF